MLVSAVLAVLATAAHAAPQHILAGEQQILTLAALEEHLSSVPEGSVGLLS